MHRKNPDGQRGGALSALLGMGLERVAARRENDVHPRLERGQNLPHWEAAWEGPPSCYVAADPCPPQAPPLIGATGHPIVSRSPPPAITTEGGIAFIAVGGVRGSLTRRNKNGSMCVPHRAKRPGALGGHFSACAMDAGCLSPPLQSLQLEADVAVGGIRGVTGASGKKLGNVYIPLGGTA